MRWRLAILVSIAIAISYLDRQTLPVAIHSISKDIPLSNPQFSALQSAFLLSYALMYAGGGKLVDLLGTERGFTLIMLFWSLASASHAMATSFALLATSRFLLGMGEGGGFPAATRAVAEYFPIRDRATAMGIINAGSSVGAVIAPPFIAVILLHASWRWIFVATAAFGLLWTVFWISFGASRRVTSYPASIERMPSRSSDFRWTSLFTARETWGLITAKFLSDAAWFFYLFWLPKYLYDARGFDVKAVGAFAWMPSAAAGAGCLLGGSFSSYLVSRHFSLSLARKIALGLSATLMPFVVLIPHVTISWAIVLFCLAYFGQQSWSTLVMVLPADLFPSEVVGSVAGLVGFGGAMGGIAFGELVGYLLDHGLGYTTVFALAGTLHVAAFLVILVCIRTVEPLTLKSRSYEGFH